MRKKPRRNPDYAYRKCQVHHLFDDGIGLVGPLEVLLQDLWDEERVKILLLACCYQEGSRATVDSVRLLAGQQ
jgi:hypothetical protein